MSWCLHYPKNKELAHSVTSAKQMGSLPQQTEQVPLLLLIEDDMVPLPSLDLLSTGGH